MQTLNDLPDDIKTKAQQYAQGVINHRDAHGTQDAALHALYLIMTIISASPEFWLTVEAIAAGDFKAAEALFE